MGTHRTIGTSLRTIAALAAVASLVAVGTARPRAASAADKTLELLNVSYDPTRELWRALNEAFIAKYAKDTGTTFTIKQSHGGSGAQARAIVDGLDADVATLALWPDTDAVRKAGLIADGWDQRLPNNSVAYTSTIVFVVRKGNPKGIKDWPDIVKPGVEIVTPNPKTSGNGKLSLLAAWGSVTQRGGTEEQAKELITKLYKQTPVLDSGARGSTTTFAQKKIGDVHLTWENEAYPEVQESGGELEIIYPPISILAEPPLAWVDANVKRKGTRDAAEAYLKFLYTKDGQEIIAKNFYRPIDPEILKQHASSFPEIKRFPVTAIAKDWADA
ncbi:MAG TPA: sulfate ABC transporter substrate-binding protein, partial [Candidatus Acidoferrales bacterium]|nr:sulfate ABC transporter substrate-binding protein [Candidatus Acidoferrales bacterium]